VVCNTVAYAHARGVIHRDLKGQNVILGDFGEVVVLDWGLAKLAGQPEPKTCGDPISLGEEWPRDRHLTTEGQVIGTPAFMAPEQASGRLDLVDHRTDIYGLGAMLYEVLTGQPPFAGPSSDEVLRKVADEEPQPPHEIWEEVPPDLEVVCSRAMAKKQADRYGSARELAHDVQGWQDSQRRRVEQALRESEAFYYALVESLPHCILRKDLEGRFTFANQGACHYLGRPLEEIIGKTDYDVGPAELAEKYRRDDQHVLTTGSILETVEELQGVDGPRIHIQIIKAPVYDRQGVPIGTQVVFWDVTDRKRLEDEIRQKTAALARAKDRLRELGDPPIEA
jgi:PAS domain S-box-containing protein